MGALFVHEYHLLDWLRLHSCVLKLARETGRHTDRQQWYVYGKLISPKVSFCDASAKQKETRDLEIYTFAINLK